MSFTVIQQDSRDQKNMQNIILHVIVTKIVHSLDYIKESYKIYFN